MGHISPGGLVRFTLQGRVARVGVNDATWLTAVPGVGQVSVGVDGVGQAGKSWPTWLEFLTTLEVSMVRLQVKANTRCMHVVFICTNVMTMREDSLAMQTNDERHLKQTEKIDENIAGILNNQCGSFLQMAFIRSSPCTHICTWTI